jgi:hypothetical protein
MSDIQIIQNRGQQFFLLSLSIVILISVVLFSRPILFLRTLSLMEIILYFDTVVSENRAVKFDTMPRIETELLKSSVRFDLPTRVPDIFKYDRSVSARPKTVRLVPRPPRPVKPVQPVVKAPEKPASPSKNPAFQAEYRLEKLIDEAYKKIEFIGRINRSNQWCAMVKFKAFDSDIKKRIITVAPGQEIFPDSKVFLKEAGQSKTTGDYYIVLETTGPGNKRISRFFATEN